uniref:C2H2-type domain-containing protein n=1 Tax=Strongyloides venezuelensis TaxID=75913 RepID=A0A0K0G1Y5_STRVS
MYQETTSMRSDNSFYCFICDKKITSINCRHSHFENHINLERFKCLDCNIQYRNIKDWMIHYSITGHSKCRNIMNPCVQKFLDILPVISLEMENSKDRNGVDIDIVVKKEKNGTLRIQKCVFCHEKGSNFLKSLNINSIEKHCKEEHQI